MALLYLNKPFCKKPTDIFSCTLTKYIDLRSTYPGIGDDIQMIEGNGLLYGKSTDLCKDENFSTNCQPTGSSTCDGADDLIDNNGNMIKSYKYRWLYCLNNYWCDEQLSTFKKELRSEADNSDMAAELCDAAIQTHSQHSSSRMEEEKAI